MEGGGRSFEVDTRPTKDVVVSSLTKDASIEACVFDLIDNAIDAARNSIFARESCELDGFGLPASYRRYRVDLTISDATVRVSDNCGGIRVSDLQEMVLRFGRRSHHQLGIGLYGVGLNRAIFKLGTSTHLDTDTGDERAVLELDNKKYLEADDEWKLPA